MLFERCHSYGRIAAFGAGLAALWTASALAQTTTPDAAPAAPADPYAGNLLGGLWGLRPFVSKYGVSLTLQEQSESSAMSAAASAGVLTMTG
jgi:hypothetical protein